jgi:hypothetical protein
MMRPKRLVIQGKKKGAKQPNLRIIMKNMETGSRVDEIRRSMDDLLTAITSLCDAGMTDEANILLAALGDLKKSLNRIKISDEGNVVMVH